MLKQDLEKLKSAKKINDLEIQGFELWGKVENVSIFNNITEKKEQRQGL